MLGTDYYCDRAQAIRACQSKDRSVLLSGLSVVIHKHSPVCNPMLREPKHIRDYYRFMGCQNSKKIPFGRYYVSS